jgi:hypothetical protein
MMKEETHWHLVRAGPANVLEDDSAVSEIVGEADCKSELEGEDAVGLDSVTASTEVGMDSTSGIEVGGDSEVGAGTDSEVAAGVDSEVGAGDDSVEGVGRDSMALEEEADSIGL